MLVCARLPQRQCQAHRSKRGRSSGTCERVAQTPGQPASFYREPRPGLLTSARQGQRHRLGGRCRWRASRGLRDAGSHQGPWRVCCATGVGPTPRASATCRAGAGACNMHSSSLPPRQVTLALRWGPHSEKHCSGWDSNSTEQRPDSEHTETVPDQEDSLPGLRPPHPPFPTENFRLDPKLHQVNHAAPAHANSPA